MDPLDLFRDNQGLAWLLARKLFVPRFRPIVDADDVLQCALLGLFKAAVAFDPSRGCKFSTMAYVAIRWEVGHLYITHRRREGKLRVGRLDREDLVEARPDRVSAEDLEEAGRLLDLLDAREADMVRERFFRRKTLREVGAEHGVTESRAAQVVSKGLRKLRRLAGAEALQA